MTDTCLKLARYMPTYRRSKKMSPTAGAGEGGVQAAAEGGAGRRDRIAPAQWREENSTRCQRWALSIVRTQLPYLYLL